MKKQDILVSYDVETITPEGKRRLRHVAKICCGFGQRVQYSVFECRVTKPQREMLEAKLRKTMKEDKDSLRIYELIGGRDAVLTVYGRDSYIDFDAPLIL